MFVIFDVDNCLSADSWRLQFIRRDDTDINRKYDLYHMLSAFDTVGNLATLTQYLPNDIILFTAMPEKYNMVRRTWLSRNNIRYREMYMRETDDHRCAEVVKQEMLDRFMADYDLMPEDVSVAYDDHPEVIQMYKDNGIRAVKLFIHNDERGN